MLVIRDVPVVGDGEDVEARARVVVAEALGRCLPVRVRRVRVERAPEPCTGVVKELQLQPGLP
jgi:hypothetical protein